MTGFDQRRGAKIDVADTRKQADNSDKCRTSKADGDNFQMGSAIGTIHGITHGRLSSFLLVQK
jgi:hypothetical protein